MFNLSPKEDKFYDLFIENAEIAYKAALKLDEFLNNLDNREENLKMLKELEHAGDQKIHQILQELNKTFITPFDREDIFAIAKEMDNIVDNIETSASRFVMFNVSEATEESKKLSKMIVDITEESINMMKELKNMNRSNNLLNKVIQINKIEEDGDAVSRQAIKELFIVDIPVIEVLKWREIYQYLEDTLDSCEDVANLVEGVVMKNA